MHDKTFVSNFIPVTLTHEFKYPYMMSSQSSAPSPRLRAEKLTNPYSRNYSGLMAGAVKEVE